MLEIRLLFKDLVKFQTWGVLYRAYFWGLILYSMTVDFHWNFLFFSFLCFSRGFLCFKFLKFVASSLGARHECDFLSENCGLPMQCCHANSRQGKMLGHSRRQRLSCLPTSTLTVCAGGCRWRLFVWADVHDVITKISRIDRITQKILPMVLRWCALHARAPL